MTKLYVAFKGKGNSSNKIVHNLSGNKLFLTNSYDGLVRDIYSIDLEYDLIYMFGMDKTLKGDIRIEPVAKRNDVYIKSKIDLNTIVSNLNQFGVVANLGNTPLQSLCNEAYWHMLKKYNGNVVFFHVPSIKYITENFIEAIRKSIFI